jgi:hypothetical protein
MPCVEFEPKIPASERAKTVHALDRSATVTGLKFNKEWKSILSVLVAYNLYIIRSQSRSYQILPHVTPHKSVLFEYLVFAANAYFVYFIWKQMNPWSAEMRAQKQISKLTVTVGLSLCVTCLSMNAYRDHASLLKRSLLNFALEMFTALIMKSVIAFLWLIIVDWEMKTNMYKTIRHHILEYRILLLNLLKVIKRVKLIFFSSGQI